MPSWRTMQPSDRDAVTAIAEKVHPGFPERTEVLMEKQALCPWACHVLVGDTSLGYVLSHPWRSGSVPKLDAFLEAIPSEADVLYIHDLALLPDARGMGAAREIIAQLKVQATEQGFTRMALCAVNGSVPFWTGQGFEVVPDPNLAKSLASYGEDARYMIRSLESDG
jgi:GNAT superfamily N-acetyltransferase